MTIKSLIILHVIFHIIDAMELPLPFPVLVKNPTYVDKTRFISEIFNNGDNNIIFTSPSGFGKTVIISMIEQFAGMKFNSSASIDETFQKTEIARDAEFLRKHQSQYIVLKLNIDVGFSNTSITPESIRDKLLDFLSISLENHLPALKQRIQQCQSSNSTADSEFLDALFSKNISVSDTRITLREIIKILSKYFNRKVILLIDHYDHIAEGFLSKRANLQVEMFYKELNTMIHYASDLSSTSIHLFKILIMTATTTPLQWISNPEHTFEINFNHYEFLKPHCFLDLMGFTETEVNRLIDQFNLKSEEKQTLLTYYNAYRTYPDNKKIYCPRSIIRYIKIYRNTVISDVVLSTVYKQSLKYIGFIAEHLNEGSRLEMELLSIINNQSVPFRFNFIPKFSLQKINVIVNHNVSNQIAISKLAWNHLYETGFLTPVVQNSSCLYKVANEETRRVLYKLLLDHHNESRLPFIEIGKCSVHFVDHDVILNKHSLASLFGLVEFLLGRCINNTAEHLFSSDNELKYQAILYISSSQFANYDFVVSTMQFTSRTNDTYYGVYYYKRHAKICSIVMIKDSNEAGKEKEVLLNDVATSYSLPHADVKHLMYAAINVFEDGHLETFYTTYERY